jgi:hypothetical protein
LSRKTVHRKKEEMEIKLLARESKKLKAGMKLQVRATLASYNSNWKQQQQQYYVSSREPLLTTTTTTTTVVVVFPSPQQAAAFWAPQNVVDDVLG